MRKQQPGMPPYPGHHPSSKEMQLWQRQLVYKQIQELQRQQQQLDQGARQQNWLSQAAAREAVANHVPGLLNGMPINDASGYMLPNDIMGGESKVPNSSQMFIADNTIFAQGRGSPGALGSNILTNGYGQAIHPTGFTPQQFGQSLYVAPVSSSRGLLNQYPQLQGMPSNFTDVMAKAVRSQLEKAPAHSAPSNSFQAKSLFMNSPMQSLSGGAASANFQQANHPQNSIQAQEFSLRHEQAGWSSNFVEKTAMQVGPSRNVTSLDPEEEKILFGTDDDGNLGASLGRILGTGGPHGDPYDGDDQFGAFPSLQSGSWSALMQEAVQASSSDEGFREEWSGLSFQKTDTSIANTSIHNDVVKHQVTWDNSNNYQGASTVNLRPSPCFNDANSGPPFPTAPTFLHSNRTTCEENNRVQRDDSHESLQHTSVDEQNLQFNLSHRKKQFLEGRLESQIQSNDVPHGVWSKQMYEQSVKSADSASMELTLQNNQGTWIHQGNVPLSNINRQPDANPIGWTKTSEGPDDNRTLFAQNGDDSYSGIKPVKSDIGSSQIQSLPSSTSNFAAVTNSNNLNANQGMNQHPLNRYQVDLGKHVAYDSFVKSRGENVEECINPPGKGQQVQDSSANSVDPSPSISDSQTSSGLSGWKTVGSRRFQSHPSENLSMNAESADSPKDTAYSQSLPKSVIQQFESREQGYADNSQFSGHGVSHAAKGRTTGMRRGINSPKESQYRSTVPMQTSQNMLKLLHRVDNSRDNNVACFGNSDLNSVHNTDDLGASDGSVPHHPHPSSASQGFGLPLASPSHRRQVSNHDLQVQTSLLNRRQVESDTEDKDQMQSASTGSDPSLNHAHEASPKENLEVRSDFYGQKRMEMPQFIPQGNFSAVPASNHPHMGHQLQMWKQKQLLQQQERISNLTGREVMRSQSDVQEPNNRASFLRQAQIFHNVALASQSAQISLPSMAGRMLPFRLDSSADAHGPVSQFNPPNTGHSEPSNAGSYLLRTSAQQFPSVEAGPVVQASARSGISQQTGFSTMLHNVWANASAQQVVSGHQTNDQVNTGGSIPSELGASHNSQQFTDDADKNPMEGKSLHETDSEGGDGTLMIGNALQEQEQLSKHHSDRNLGNVPHLNVSRGTQWPNVEASNSVVGLHGHTVLPSQVQNRNYSLLQQMQVMKSADSDASKRDEKRLKVELGASSNSYFPSDVKMLSFSSVENKDSSTERTAQFVGREGSSHDICPSGQPDLKNQSQPLTSTSDFIGRNEQPMLPPQMSCSWLQQYRKYNGQIVAMLADQKSTKAANESSPPLQLGGTGHDIVIRSKKRKTAPSELLPWHQVVSFGSQRLQSISMAEQGWAQATNRLLEKVEDAAELIEDGSLMPRTRGRLILTTQLMQQLLPPIPASILSAEVTSSYESVAYLLAKSALGDACSLTSRPGSDYGVHLNNENRASEKRRTSEKANEVFFSKVVENFIGRSRKLETDFTRLDKKTSILDIKLEWQEVERFSLINRLGKYHARSQADAAESSSTSQNAPRKIFPQRHVTAFSMLGNVPEGVHCLSL